MLSIRPITSGKVFAVGRFDYGRLGIGPIPPNDGICNASSCCIPQPVLGPLSDRRCITIGCGEAVSFAVSEDGLAHSWGMGSSQQLGHGDDDGDCYEPTEMIGKNLENRRIIMVDAGGQHCVLLASRPSVTEGATGNLSGPNDVSTSFQNSSRCSPPRSAAHKPSATDSAAATGPTSFSTHTNATTHSDQENGEDRMELDHPIDSLAQLGVPIIVIDGKSVTRYQCNFQEETCHHHSYPSQATGLPCETIEDKELPRSQKQAVSEPVALEGEMGVYISTYACILASCQPDFFN
ncbi:unnamed protein product [Protopolystoma xenopodis]|uniref:Uncharacterized protein n=1 Tax=Protopolystoma xenopodis TaxID=117903 RepID=A0A448WC15_9PLAT|nr:unnamed protein product [Protopolystoma xenopodis]